jgi:hypothetical protein
VPNAYTTFSLAIIETDVNNLLPTTQLDYSPILINGASADDNITLTPYIRTTWNDIGLVAKGYTYEYRWKPKTGGSWSPWADWGGNNINNRHAQDIKNSAFALNAAYRVRVRSKKGTTFTGAPQTNAVTLRYPDVTHLKWDSTGIEVKFNIIDGFNYRIQLEIDQVEELDTTVTIPSTYNTGDEYTWTDTQALATPFTNAFVLIELKDPNTPVIVGDRDTLLHIYNGS